MPWVQVNPPNKAAQIVAEVGGERARTEENIVQSHRRPTLSGKSLSQALNGVRQLAKDRKQERFTALLHHLSVTRLRDSFYALKRQASSGGRLRPCRNRCLPRTKRRVIVGR